MNVLEAVEVTKVYSIGDRRIPVVDRVSLSVQKSEFLVVEGSSGSGKTTLLSLLSGLDRPTSGRVLVLERDITDMGEDDLAPPAQRGHRFCLPVLSSRPLSDGAGERHVPRRAEAGS